MQMILKRDWQALDGSESDKIAVIPAGCHEVERVPNPFGHRAPWLVLRGTLIGGSEGSWRQWENGDFINRPEHPNFGSAVDWGDWEVQIIE